MQKKMSAIFHCKIHMHKFDPSHSDLKYGRKKTTFSKTKSTHFGEI